MQRPREPELTLRAVLTGTALGAVLSLCNLYSGLKIGWGFNMSITAALLAFGAFRALAPLGVRPLSMLENNLNQAAASAGASIASAGLVSAMPALTLVTGRVLGWSELAAWTFLVSALGVLVGVILRRPMIEIDKLPFASGIAAAETLERMHASGREAMAKVRALVVATLVAAGWKLAQHARALGTIALPGSIAVGAERGRASLLNLTVGLDPSPLMIAIGALGSLRSGLSMGAGALVAWLVVAPIAIEHGWAEVGPSAPSAVWFGPVVKWLLWPGVALMVSASLTSVALSWPAIARTFRRSSASDASFDAAREPSLDDVPWRAFWLVSGAIALATIAAQIVLFDIRWWAATLAVGLTLVLASVAGRVTGEAGITPIGAMGKVTQLVFGALLPASPTANLMSANVTGGAAAQCADLLIDLKTGAILRASPRNQAISQMAGALGGALVGSAAYLAILHDPKTQIGSAEWPAPAVATWKAVAEVFSRGLSAMPPYALAAMAAGAVAGVALAVAEKKLPARMRPFVPSPAALGLGFVVQAWYGLSVAIGAIVGAVLRRAFPAWSERLLVPVLSGVVAGESLMGVAIAIHRIAMGS
jgi:putative OPT family oligopeptide transporter